MLARGVDNLQSGITPQTAMVYTTWRDDRLPNTLKITRAAGVPPAWTMRQVFPV